MALHEHQIIIEIIMALLSSKLQQTKDSAKQNLYCMNHKTYRTWPYLHDSSITIRERGLCTNCQICMGTEDTSPSHMPDARDLPFQYNF
jgi:hypothetical protein